MRDCVHTAAPPDGAEFTCSGVLSNGTHCRVYIQRLTAGASRDLRRDALERQAPDHLEVPAQVLWTKEVLLHAG